jgi:hypothetical protein
MIAIDLAKISLLYNDVRAGIIVKQWKTVLNLALQ